MQVATAMRIVSVVVAAKALLIGVVYWRRAEILGRPVHIGAGSWACLIAVVTIGVAIALTRSSPCRARLNRDVVCEQVFRVLVCDGL